MEIRESAKFPNDHLDRLAQFLNYELSASLLFFFSFVVWIFIFIAILIAGVFIPYLIYVLLKEGRHGWIISFNVMILTPLIISILFLPSYFSIFMLLSVALFYCYCFFLRITVNEWIRERNWRLQLIEQRNETEKSKNIEF
jgi:hypothetical protein